MTNIAAPIQASLGAAQVETLRRQAVQGMARKLTAAGLCLSAAEERQCRAERWALGSKLQRELVNPLVSESDRLYLTRPPAGRYFGRPRMRLPLMLAFGHDCGWWLDAALDGGGGGSDEAARICAIFNVGISLFDKVCDSGGAAVLSRILDEGTLESLGQGVRREGYLEGVSSAMTTPELRLLIAMVLLFFAKVHRLAAQGNAAGGAEHLQQLLVRAYRAELTTATARHAGTAAPDLHAAARQKSELPFEIMLAVARLRSDGSRGEAAGTLAQRLGSLFSLVDDLADLAKDYERGDANTILLSAGPTVALSDALDEAVTDCIRRLTAALESGRACGDAVERQRFRVFLLSYMQSWLS